MALNCDRCKGSESKEGKILAGKLSLRKKGVEGFATAGGNSNYPYNPLRAAREESTAVI